MAGQVKGNKLAPIITTNSELCKAVQRGNENLTRRLLEEGADVHEMHYHRGFGEPLILTAIRFQHFHIIPVLVEFGADVNQPSERSHTPLIRAAQKNRLDIVEMLLEHSADPNVLDSSRVNALCWAVKHSNVKIFEALIKYGASVNTNVHQQSTLLHVAASAGKFDMVQTLIDHNACVNAPDDFGNSPLFSAVGVNNFDITSLLLKTGSVVNMLNMDYRTPLHMSAASVHRSVDITQLLLDHGALVNVPDRYGNIPLVLSLRNFVLLANVTVAKCLVQHGSELNTEKCRGALEWTIMAHGNFDLVRASIEAGFHARNVDWVNEFLQGTPGRRRWYTRNDYNIRQEKGFLDYLRNYLKNPMSLSQCCRIVIRNTLISVSNGASIYYKIQRLPLPNPIIMYLVLEE